MGAVRGVRSMSFTSYETSTKLHCSPNLMRAISSGNVPIFMDFYFSTSCAKCA